MLKIVVNSLFATSVGLFGFTATTLSASASPTPLSPTIPSPVSTTLNATNTLVANSASPIQTSPTIPSPVSTTLNATNTLAASSQKWQGNLTETTATAVGSTAGAGTDSQTSAGVNVPNNPIKPRLRSEI